MIREGEVLYLGDLRILKKSLACFQVRTRLINSGAIYSRAKTLNFWWVYELYVYVRSFVAMAAKRISKIILIHTYRPQFLCIDFFLVLCAAFAFRHIVVNQFQSRMLSIFNEFASIYEKHHPTVLRNNLPGPFSLYIFFLGNRELLFFSVYLL